jgi:hypothetical protein
MGEIIKVKSICVDTLTGIQTIQYMTDKKKPGHDKWKDYGQAIYTFMDDLINLGFEIVLILGDPGTGKSSGMRTLETGTNIWFNADAKNPVWIGGREEYGKKTEPKLPYHLIPKTYKEILDHIKLGIEKDMFEKDRIAFLTGHTETYKDGNEVKSRLKTLGNMATNMQLEGRLETVMYARVETKGESGEREYLLHTQNDGNNTARSPMGLFEGKIPNDYKLIRDAILNY